MKSSITLTAITTCCLLLSTMACEENEAQENTKLKTMLLGTWTQEQTSGANYNYFEITFTEDALIWSDSISVLNYPGAENGSIQTMKGTCPVKYTFNDGVEYYNPNGSKVYSFKNFKEPDILWVFEADYTKNVYQDYEIQNSVIIKKGSFEGSPYMLPVLSSAVKFSSDQKTVTFCESRDIDWCYDFERK